MTKNMKTQTKNITFMTFITNITLRTTLIPFTSFINVTRPTHGELAFVTRNKHISILLSTNLVATNLAYVGM